MKIKSIAQLCKKGKRVDLYTQRKTDEMQCEQYIGSTAAAYLVTGLPPLDEDSILTIFDIPQKQRAEWDVRISGIPEKYDFGDTNGTEERVEEIGMSIMYAGILLIPLRTSRGIVFIDNCHLAPLTGVTEMDFYMRRTTDGQAYIVVKAGFLFQVAIMPYDVIRAEFVNMVKLLADQCEYAFDNKWASDNQDDKEAAHQQTTINIDPETGEWLVGEGE